MYQHFIFQYLYEAQHVSGDTPPIIRSLKLHRHPLVFHTWKVVGRVVGGRCQAQCARQRLPATRPTTFHVWKTRGCRCSFRLLMMGGVSPETCWASYKYGIIKCWYIVAFCWIFLYELAAIPQCRMLYETEVSDCRVLTSNCCFLTSVHSLKFCKKLFWYSLSIWLMHRSLLMY